MMHCAKHSCLKNQCTHLTFVSAYHLCFI